jgi:transcriptional regulator with XRE-family HTH domain
MPSENGHKRTALFRARKLRRLTLEELARESGVTIGCISRIETGETAKPHRLTRRALARALGYRPVDIWPRAGERPHPELRAKKTRRS